MQQIIFQYVCSSKVVGTRGAVCRFSKIWINSPTHRVYSLRTEKLDEIASNFLQHLFNFRDWSLTMQSLIPSSKVEGFKLLLAKIAAAQVKCSYYLNWVIEKKRSIRQKSIAGGQICRTKCTKVTQWVPSFPDGCQKGKNYRRNLTKLPPYKVMTTDLAGAILV